MSGEEHFGSKTHIAPLPAQSQAEVPVRAIGKFYILATEILHQMFIHFC